MICIRNSIIVAVVMNRMTRQVLKTGYPSPSDIRPQIDKIIGNF